LALADTATLPPPPPPESDSLVSAKVESLGRRLDRDSAAAKSSLADGRSLGLLAVQILLALSVVTGLGFATVFAWSRLRRRNGSGQSGEIDVLETRALQPGRHLQLVRLHNRVVAIVTTAHGAAAVAEFRDNEAAEIIAELGAGTVSTKDFGAALDTLLERFRKPGSKGPEA
jgi:flagellar biogenesis protein FliO